MPGIWLKLKFRIPCNHYGKLKKLTEPGQEVQFTCIGNLHNNKINGDVQILKAVDRFSKWPTAKKCKTAETKKVVGFPTKTFILFGIPEPLFQKSTRNCVETELHYLNIVHPAKGTVGRAIQTSKKEKLTNLEKGTDFKESVNRDLRVLRFTIRTGLKRTPFELHHSGKTRAELTYIGNDGKTYSSDQSEKPI